MAVLLLERALKTPPTRTDSLLDESPRFQAVAASPQDSAITVIENPAASNDRYLGLLFAGQFVQTAGADMPVRTFRQAHYFRLDVAEFLIVKRDEIPEVQMRQGFDPLFGRRYDFLDAGDARGMLPLPSEIPYAVAFMPPALYDRYLSIFKDDPKQVFPDGLSDVYSSIASRVRGFRVDTTRGLIMPPNYASYRLPSLVGL
jgi:hypothetical protein